jgi:hypothetical protein
LENKVDENINWRETTRKKYYKILESDLTRFLQRIAYDDERLILWITIDSHIPVLKTVFTKRTPTGVFYLNADLKL